MWAYVILNPFKNDVTSYCIRIGNTVALRACLNLNNTSSFCCRCNEQYDGLRLMLVVCQYVLRVFYFKLPFALYNLYKSSRFIDLGLLSQLIMCSVVVIELIPLTTSSAGMETRPNRSSHVLRTARDKVPPTLVVLLYYQPLRLDSPSSLSFLLSINFSTLAPTLIPQHGRRKHRRCAPLFNCLNYSSYSD